MRRPDATFFDTDNTTSNAAADGVANASETKKAAVSSLAAAPIIPLLANDKLSVDASQAYWAAAEEDAMKEGPAYQKMRRVDRAALRSEGGSSFADAALS